MKLGDIKEAIEGDCAKMASEDFVNAGKKIIEDFYSGYSPIYYNRTDALRNSPMTPIIDGNRGGVEFEITGYHNGYKDGTMWMSGVRGLPEGYKGYVEHFVSRIEEFGITASSPDEALKQLEERWFDVRKKEIDKICDKYLSQLEL